MPELPEVEQLRRSLTSPLNEARILSVQVNRPDFILTCDPLTRPAMPPLLVGDRIKALHRRGKQLAIEGGKGETLVAHLGMTGRVRVFYQILPALPHAHVLWTLQTSSGRRATLAFQDPRRFGYLKSFPSIRVLESTDWASLGPDALTLSAGHLASALKQTSRPIKTVLLDQSILAGVGNIYADEALFSAGIHPRRKARLLRDHESSRLASAIRDTLAHAVSRGGTTIRDYVDGSGTRGEFVKELRVYGRAGLSCLICNTTLRHGTISQRMTVWCPKCQPPRPSSSSNAQTAHNTHIIHVRSHTSRRRAGSRSGV